MKDIKRVILLCIAVLCMTTTNATNIIPDGLYYIFSAVDGNYTIDDNGSGVYNGNNIHLWKLNKTKAQQWRVENRNGAIIIRSALNNNFVIDDNGSNAFNGNNIHLWEYNGSNAQLWYPQKVDSRRELYVLRSAVNSNYVIDLNGGNATDGNNIQLWEYNGSNAQKWLFMRVGEVEFTDAFWDALFGL